MTVLYISSYFPYVCLPKTNTFQRYITKCFNKTFHRNKSIQFPNLKLLSSFYAVDFLPINSDFLTGKQ